MRKNKVLTIWAAIVFAFLMIPLLIITVTAFGGGSAITFPIESFSTKWFANVFALKSFRRSFLTSLEVALLATCISLLVGIPAAYALARSGLKGKQLLKSIFLSPTIVPGIVIGFIMYQCLILTLRIPGVRGTSRRTLYGDTSVCDPRSRFFDGAVRLFNRGGGVEPRMPEGSGVLQGRSSKCDLRNFLSIHAGVHQFLQQHSGVHVLIPDRVFPHSRQH